MTDSTKIEVKKPTLKSLFPNGEEKYLSVLVKLFDQDILRIIICNDRLAENKNIWKKTAEFINDTDLQLTLGTINKDDFRLLKAADVLNSADGLNSISCVNTQGEYIKIMKELIVEYKAAKEISDNLGLPTNQLSDITADAEDVGNTAIGTYTPQSEEEIEFMYQ